MSERLSELTQYIEFANGVRLILPPLPEGADAWIINGHTVEPSMIKTVVKGAVADLLQKDFDADIDAIRNGSTDVPPLAINRDGGGLRHGLLDDDLPLLPGETSTGSGSYKEPAVRKTPGGEVAQDLFQGRPVEEVAEFLNQHRFKGYSNWRWNGLYARFLRSQNDTYRFANNDEIAAFDPVGESLALERAVQVLNAHNHNGYTDWKMFTDGGHNSHGTTSVNYLNAGNNSYDGDAYLTEFEAIAIAERYERETK